jgi:uncharacterized protein (TIGR03435 family)
VPKNREERLPDLFEKIELMRTLALAVVLKAALAQDTLPQFEVATVKLPGAADRVIALFNYPGGRIQITNYTFEQLLEEAFRIQRFQISGAPGWIDSERFMIEAKPPASSELGAFTPFSREAPLVDVQRQMLLALLIDRFHLKFHRESKEGPVYLLVKGQKDPKLDSTLHPAGACSSPACSAAATARCKAETPQSISSRRS